MPKQLNIHYNGQDVEVYVYSSRVEDGPSLLCDAGNAVNALLEVEGADPCPCETVAAKSATAPAGFDANGQIIASIGALMQKAIANAPALIAEIQTLAPEIQALIALFGKTPSTTV
jgi:hypothetical protein